MSEPVLYVKGRFLPKSESNILSPYDNSFLYGDGIFEGLRVTNGFIFQLDRHLDRLYRSALSIDLEVPMTRSDLTNLLINFVRKNKMHDGYIRIVMSAGEGRGVGLRKAVNTKPYFVIVPQESVDMWDTSLDLIPSLKPHKAVISNVRSIPPACGIEARTKSNSYLNHIMAQIDARKKGADFAICLDANGYVTEAEAFNVFVVSEGAILTPPVYLGMLEGITRQSIREVCDMMKISFEEKVLTPYDLYCSDELFVASTASPVLPITEVDGRKIGEGNVGNFTKKIYQKIWELTRNGWKGTLVFGIKK
jgi:branched-chain amino acid aminotransferase